MQQPHSGEASISQIFDESLNTFQEISDCDLPTNHSDVQYKVKKCMNVLEDVTRMVSTAGIFSCNESVNEIPTSDLKLILLPAILGTLALKLTNGERKEIVETAEIYFRDFLQRCKDYGIEENIEIPGSTSNEECSTSTSSSGNNTDLFSMAKRRATKIQQFHQQKQLEEKLKMLKKRVESSDVDEDVKRDYYTSLIKNFINKALDDLDCLITEKSILSNADRCASLMNDETERKRTYKSKPLQPVIITRDELQKKVYGAGYPSLPTMTVEELYKKRIEDGTWSVPSSSSSRSLMSMAANEELTAKQNEEDDIAKEKAIEVDDEEMIERLRNMDEYKDTHKRGWGNRMNRS